MQKFKKHLTGILLISIAVIGITASSSSQKAESASNFLLPKDFDPNKQTLLIEKAGSNEDVKGMQDYMSSNYPYKYEFVSWDDLNADKYADDSTTYRFVLRKVHTTTYDYLFYDRIHSESYEKSGSDSKTPEKPLEKIAEKIVKKYK